MARYDRDPRWLEARYPGKCAGDGCQDVVRKGDRIFYYPLGKQVLVGKCADKASKEFSAAAMDEASMVGDSW